MWGHPAERRFPPAGLERLLLLPMVAIDPKCNSIPIDPENAYKVGRNGPHGRYPGVRTKPAKRWTPGSCKVDGNLESDHPTWIMWACRGNWRIDLASGPLATKPQAEQIAAMINRTEPELWDLLFSQDLRHLVSHSWG